MYLQKKIILKKNFYHTFKQNLSLIPSIIDMEFHFKSINSILINLSFSVFLTL
jgi:hypothetical protein